MQDIEFYGARTTASAATNTSAINAAINAEAAVLVPEKDYQVSLVGIVNPLGKQYIGQGRLLDGKRLVNPSTDAGQHIFGQEYLHPLFQKILDRTAKLTVVFSGDSTTENWGQGNHQINKIFERVAADKGHVVTAINRGHGGQHTETWRTAYINSDLALYPDLYILRWGLNDVTNYRTIAQYAKSLRDGLAAIRSTRGVASLPILLMSPNSTSEYTANRDERWLEQTSKVCRQAARDYGCAFIDTYALWADSRAGAGVWLDGANGQGGIHPKPVFNMTIASIIADLVFPSALRPRNIPSQMATVTPRNLPSEYQIGYSLHEMTEYDYPATVQTFRSMDGYCIQTIFGHPPSTSTPQFTTRVGRCDGINDYWYSKPYDKNGIDWQPLAGWRPLEGGIFQPRAKLSNGVVVLTGIIIGGNRANNTIIGQLPLGMRPRNAIVCGQAAMATATGIGTCYLKIESDGVISIWDSAYSGNAWLSLDGITFEVGN